jgi:hypothetical protein
MTWLAPKISMVILRADIDEPARAQPKLQKSLAIETERHFVIYTGDHVAKMRRRHILPGDGFEEAIRVSIRAPVQRATAAAFCYHLGTILGGLVPPVVTYFALNYNLGAPTDREIARSLRVAHSPLHAKAFRATQLLPISFATASCRPQRAALGGHAARDRCLAAQRSRCRCRRATPMTSAASPLAGHWLCS